MHALHLTGTDFPFPAASGTVRGAAPGTLPKLSSTLFRRRKHPARVLISNQTPESDERLPLPCSFDDLIQINGSDCKSAQHILIDEVPIGWPVFTFTARRFEKRKN